MAGVGSRSQTTTLFLVTCAKLVFDLVLPTRESSTMGALVTTVISEAGLHKWESRVPNRTKFIHRTQIEVESFIRQSRLLLLHFNSVSFSIFFMLTISHMYTTKYGHMNALYPSDSSHTSCVSPNFVYFFYYNLLCPVNVVLRCKSVQPSPWQWEP